MSDPLPAQDENPKGFIRKILAPAIRFWLKSQVDRIEQLHLEIEAGDRQILSGVIPKVTLAAQSTVYHGIHLSKVHLIGENIRVNLGQVLRGKPLQLLAPIPIALQVLLAEADLNASLQAPLLANAVKEFLLELLQSGGDFGTADADSPLSNTDQTPDAIKNHSKTAQLNLQDLNLKLEDERLVLCANLISKSGNVTAIAIRTALQLHQANRILLRQPQWLPHPTAKRGLPLEDLEGYPIHLGEATHLESLTITPGQLQCQGQLQVNP
jgi:LmeA-like phospholipid-binding